MSVQGINSQTYNNLLQFQPFREKINPGDQITKEKAIKILKGIERSTKIKSFLTKPVVVVLTSVAALAIGMTLLMTAPLALPIIALAIAMKVAGYISTIGGIAVFSSALVHNFNLSQLSRAYAYQSRTAQQFIWDLKSQDAVRI